MAVVTNLTFEAGFIIVHRDAGPPTKYSIADMLRAADIPALTFTQVGAITGLANFIAILIRTLIERGVLDESFTDGKQGINWSLAGLIEIIEALGGSYSEPDFDDV